MSSSKRQLPTVTPPSRRPPPLPGQGSTGHRNLPVPKRPPPSAPPSAPQFPRPTPSAPAANSSTSNNSAPQVSKSTTAAAAPTGNTGQGGSPDSIQKKSTADLLKTLSANEGLMKRMEGFLGTLTSSLKAQLDRAAALNKDALEFGQAVQGFSLEFIDGGADPHFTELGHCTVAVGNLIQAIYGAFDFDLVITINNNTTLIYYYYYYYYYFTAK